MPDPVTFSASVIAELAFQAFLKSGVGELSKRFTQEAIQKISQLHDLIWNKLRGSPDASKAIQGVKDGSEEDLNDVVTYLKSAMRNDEDFASQVQVLAKEINTGKRVDQSSMVQNNSGNAKGWQTQVEGGVVHQAENITYNYRSEPSDRDQTEFNPPTVIPNNLPRSGVKEFVGRTQKLQNLHEQLQSDQRIAITAIAGMGGMGKTELALQYAISQQEQDQYPGGFCWIRARGQEIATQVVAFTQTKLGLTLPDGLAEEKQVSYCWGQWREGEVLVVIDDVTDFNEVAPYLPPSDPRFKVLITTRLSLGSSVQSLCLEELDDESSLTLLETLVGQERIQSQLEDAKTLCSRVGNLPLGLELLGRFLGRKPDWSIQKLIERLESKNLEAKALTATESGMTAELGVAAALELSWVELNEAEQKLACLLGMFAIAPIPWHLVEGCLADEDPDDLEDTRDEGLIARNLLKRSEQDTYQLHQIVQEYFRIKLNERSDNGQLLKTDFCKAMVRIAKKIDERPTIDVIEEVRASIPHLEEVINQWSNYLSDENLLPSYEGISRFYEGQGSYGLALPWIKKCLEQTRQRLGNEHPSVAQSLDDLAFLYNNQGRYEEAVPLLTQALQMRQKLLGNEHPDVASSLNNLAALYRNQGRYEEAEPLYTQALQMRQKFLGNEHRDVATSLNDLALLYTNQGRYEEAEPLYVQALDMYKKLLGNEHRDVATNLNNLALNYSYQRQYEEAEPLYHQTLQMRQKLLGNEHPDIATSLNNLALLYRNQRRYEEAESLYKQALEMKHKLLGNEHPSVATSLNNLANLYADQGRYEEGETLYQQALQMRRKLLRNEHPSVAISMWCLGGLYQQLSRIEEAEHLYRKALSIFEEKLGPNHPDTQSIQNDLASLP